MDTVVEIKLSGLGLVLTEKKYQLSRFLMANQVRVVRALDGAVVEQRSLCYASTSTPEFSEWAAAEGTLLKEELEKAYTRTADDIQLMLAGELDATDTEEQNLCVALEETVKAYQAEMEPAR